jgi:S1-C subfamily serine protease
MDESGPTRRSFLAAVVTMAGATAGCRAPASTVTEPGGATNDSGDDATATPVPASSPYTEVYREVVPSVASVRIYGAGSQRGQGSAFVYDDRHLVTNAHVVADANRVAVRFGTSAWIAAETVATDTSSDLAVIEPRQLPDDATPLPFVAREPPIGTEVVAVGNPFGFAGSVTAGIVSGVDRSLSGPNDFSIPDAVQTDTPVNPGNSGGPLVTLDGDVVGVVNAGGGDNLGFAISAALTERVVPALLADGRYRHPYMGVLLQDVTPLVAEANDLAVASGVYVHEVLADSPAAGVLEGSSGRRTYEGVETPVGGDVIRTMDGEPIRSRQDLSTFLALSTRPGDAIPIGLKRDGERVEVALTLGRRPPP